jgi:ABC-type branched-subunit amino acid transport system ATPase component
LLDSAANPALVIDGVSAGYANNAVVRDVSFTVAAGEVVCVVGPNGAGKSTLLKGITRDAQLLGGRVTLGGEDISQTPGNQLAQRGLAWVPQLDDVFATLTVRENLELGGYLLPRKQVRQRVGEVLEIFPILGGLANRVAGRLSGGERKLLALARALMPEPSVMLLDEPSAGLSPEMTDLVMKVHITELSRRGVAVLLVEQRTIEAIAIASHVHVMVGGLVRVSRPASEIQDWDELARLFLGEG